MATRELLDSLIEATECLNQDSNHAVANVFMDGEAFLASDADVDAELLVKVTFRQPVKLAAIRIEGLAGGDTQPDSVKIYQGKPDLGFDETDAGDHTQTCELDTATVAKDGQVVELRFVKFQNVQTLQLFFPAGNDREQTQIRRLSLYGESAEKMDMKEWKPIKG